MELSSLGDSQEKLERALEGIGLVLFVAASLLAAFALARGGRAGPDLKGAPVSIGMQMRRRLVSGLLAGCSARSLAMVAELLIPDPVPLAVQAAQSAVASRWQVVRSIVTTFPAAVFLSAFSIVVFFLAQVHYTTRMVPVPFLDKLAVVTNIACYVLFAIAATCGTLLGSAVHLRAYIELVIGVLNFVVALAFVYFGLLVASELAVPALKRLPSRPWLIRRVVVLSVVCPSSLVARGVCYFAWGISPYPRPLIGDLVLILLGEWLPTVMALIILDPMQLQEPNSATYSLEDSTDSEAPLLRDTPTSPMVGAGGGDGGSGVGDASPWRQLYP